MSLTVLTYNIWFDHRHSKERLAGMLDVIRRTKPTVIGLQEVTVDMFPIIYDALTGGEAMGVRYHCNYKRPDNFRPPSGYGVCIFSLIPIERAEIIPFHQTKMGRYFVRVLLSNGICVVTTHLESLNPNSAVRQAQIQQILEHTESSEHPHVWTMDSNLTDIRDDVAPAALQSAGWHDAFQMVGSPGDHCYTYDATRNNNILNRYRSRLDRIYCKGVRC